MALVQAEIECDEDIDESLNVLDQNDLDLVNQIKHYYLTSPSSSEVKYNIPRDRLVPPLVEGQFKQALIVDLFYNKSKTPRNSYGYNHGVQ